LAGWALAQWPLSPCIGGPLTGRVWTSFGLHIVAEYINYLVIVVSKKRVIYAQNFALSLSKLK